MYFLEESFNFSATHPSVINSTNFL